MHSNAVGGKRQHVGVTAYPPIDPALPWCAVRATPVPIFQASPLCSWNSTPQVRAHHLRRQVIIASLDLPDCIVYPRCFTLEGISCRAIERGSAVVVSLPHKVCTIGKEGSGGRIREYSK